MLCDICQRPATCWCEKCDTYYCSDHGGARCFRCSGAFMELKRSEPILETAIYTTDRDSRQAGKGYLQCETDAAMPTIYIDDDGPPECCLCGALARTICSHCYNLYCPEHAAGDVCSSCRRSSRIGILVFLALLAGFGLLLILGTVFS